MVGGRVDVRNPSHMDLSVHGSVTSLKESDKVFLTNLISPTLHKELKDTLDFRNRFPIKTKQNKSSPQRPRKENLYKSKLN